MLIRCWGSRGSIPVSGKEYIKYGGDTTCLEIRTRSDDIIIVDAGTGIRRLGNALIQEGRYQYNFLLTHGHWDHLMGFPFFKPLFLEHPQIHMHRGPFHKKFMESMFSKVMAPPNFPVRYSDLKAKIFYEAGNPVQFEIGSVTVIPIQISHPNTGKGYKFIEDGKTFVFLTDNELGFVHPGGLPASEYLEFCRGADLLIHDAEYTPREYKLLIEWGHSSYLDVLELAFKAEVKQLGLFHLNQERTDDEVDEMVAACRNIIAERGVDMKCSAVAADMVFEL
ncbi:MBL fold metallo-hydrolase [Desulfatitalea tepidiphila]|uniref:MBL fold metallo-hydrolase n=1 Tax=Desulfatitalea tepidiphila TaxID=1185843 RepID=UPI0006B478C7|nr:MBL fold metallo-hydrolase [Desulfatitalea tepidiphila]